MSTPKRKNNVKVGIAGWSYPDWEGVVHAADRKLDKLRYLARFFNAIEINTTFYRIPSESTVKRWNESVSMEEDFVFTVKLLRDFTHFSGERPPKGASFAELSSGFQHAMAPLWEGKRLGALLVQFPYSFHYTRENCEYLEELFKSFGEFPLVVEVRHRSFQCNDFNDFLRRHGVGFANIDQPAVSYSVTPAQEVTSAVAYIRFHGRNAAAWFDDSAGRDQRYDYTYSTDELNDWVRRAEVMSNSAQVVYAMFNNHFRGQEVVNALEFQRLWTGSRVNVPTLLKKAYPRLEGIAILNSVDESENATTPSLFPET